MLKTPSPNDLRKLLNEIIEICPLDERIKLLHLLRQPNKQVNLDCKLIDEIETLFWCVEWLREQINQCRPYFMGENDLRKYSAALNCAIQIISLNAYALSDLKPELLATLRPSISSLVQAIIDAIMKIDTTEQGLNNG